MNPYRKRFCEEHGIPAGDVGMVCRLANQCARANEGECNGDPHADSIDRQDKNANAQAWGEALQRLSRRLAELVAPFGLKVEFTGLRPCLRDKDGRYIEIPR